MILIFMKKSRNERRLDLIQKRKSGLTKKEQAEFKALQSEARKDRDKRFPPPDVKELYARLRNARRQR